MPAIQPEKHSAIAAAQRDFAAMLLAPLPQGPRQTHAWPGLERAAYPNTSRAALGLRIYRNNVVYSLVQALRAQFPLVEKIVGAAFFGALARDHVLASPPREAALTFYGTSLPEFIAASPACSALPYLPDIARLELLCQYALHAADADALDPQRLAALAPEALEDARFTLHPSAALIASRYPLEQIRQTALREDAPALQLTAGQPEHLLVYRPFVEVLVAALDPPAFLLLRQLQQELTLSEAWRHVQEALELDTSEFVPLFAGLLRLGVLAKIQSNHEEATQ